MRLVRSRALIAALATSLIFSALLSSLFAAEKKSSKASKDGIQQLDDSKRALHALNRLTFGPRPGDIEKVQAMGVERWIEQQLHPEKIDDNALDARLSPFRTLKMSTSEIVRNFPPPQLLRAIQQGKASMPRDPEEKAIYQAAMERLKEKKQKGKDEAAPPQQASADDANAPADNGRKRKRAATQADPEEKMYAELKSEELLDMEPEARMKELMKMSPEERRSIMQSLGGGGRQEFADGLTPQQREAIQAMNNPQQVVVQELAQGKLLRTIYSERQLDEVMTDFWFNHFNIFINKAADRYLITSYERDVIRPHALGKFKDLLVATAGSPAMLFYLDNWLSVGPHSEFISLTERRAMRRPNAKAPKLSGLNENYAREIMELHTLGVDGGYTQQDVTELAKVFTGWTMKRPQTGGGFQFDERMHEPGTKHVLGHEIKSNGPKEALEMLDVLAHHPSTARFISKKLAMRFVSDDPPPALVDRMAQTFQKSDGDIREVLRTMFKSPEFWAQESYRAKVKTPLEFVASAVRASGAEVQNAMPLVQTLNKLGMPLYGMQPPTGYSTKADAWVNSAALLNRMNFGLSLASGKMRGVNWSPQQTVGTGTLPADTQGAVAVFESALVGGDISPKTHETVLKQLNDPDIQAQNGMQREGPPVNLIAGLLLGSPEFQRR